MARDIAAYCAIACNVHPCGYSFDSLANFDPCEQLTVIFLIATSNTILLSALALRVLHYSPSFILCVLLPLAKNLDRH